MRLAVYAGSFDPFTRGHGSILSGALKSFDKVVIAIGRNSAKPDKYLSVSERMQIIRDVLDEDWSVLSPPQRPQVETFNGLLVDFCTTLLNRPVLSPNVELPDSVTIVRGLRAVSDLEVEMSIADANRRLSTRFQTVFIPTEAHLAFVSSSMVRELHSHGVKGEALAHYLYPSTLRFLNAVR